MAMAIEPEDMRRLPGHHLAMMTFVCDLVHDALEVAHLVLCGKVDPDVLRKRIADLQESATISMTEFNLTDEGRAKLHELLRGIKYDSVRGKVECL